MWIKVLLLIFFGLSAGLITACGYFAVFMAVGVVNRFVQYSNTADKIKYYNYVIIASVIFGNLIYLFNPFESFSFLIGVVFFFFAGIFTGCFFLSISEAVNGVPVFSRRFAIERGIMFILLALAIGKGLGALFYMDS